MNFHIKRDTTANFPQDCSAEATKNVMAIPVAQRRARTSYCFDFLVRLFLRILQYRARARHP